MSEDYEIKQAPLEWDYVPKFRGNDKRDSPGVAKLRQLTTREMNQCIKIRATGPEVDEARILECGLVELSGFSVSGKPLKTAKDILDTAGLYGLFVELWTEIQSGCTLSEQDSKN